MNKSNNNQMNEQQFDKHVSERIEKIHHVLQIKAKEYRKNDNPFHNFDRAAATYGCTPERSLMGMLAKHQISVLDLVDDIDSGKLPNHELVSEKIGDHINYLILLEGLIYRRLSECLANLEGIGYVHKPHNGTTT